MCVWALSLQILQKAVVRAVWHFLRACSSSHQLFCFGYILVECAEVGTSHLGDGAGVAEIPHAVLSSHVQLSPRYLGWLFSLRAARTGSLLALEQRLD